MEKLKKRILVLFAVLALLLPLFGIQSASATLLVDGKTVAAPAFVENCVTYVSLRVLTETLYPNAEVSWTDGQAKVSGNNLQLTAKPGNQYLTANGRFLYIPGGVRLMNGVTLVPVRVLAKALGASVDWNPSTGAVTVTGSGRPIASGESFYNENDVYWLAKIIHAESESEPLAGKIAVGNVVLNRVSSTEFPDTVYDVIFDSRWGGQFTPVSNGRIYRTPGIDSYVAAKLCLDGAEEAGSCLYFLNPILSKSSWIQENRVYFTTIGTHCFYL